MHIAELLKLASENGGAASILAIIVIVGIYYFIKLVKIIISKIESSSEVIVGIGRALTNDKGEPISQIEHFNIVTKLLEDIKKTQQLHVEDAGTHYGHTKMIADENKVKNCDAANCPYLLKMVAEVRLFTEKFDQFEKKAQDSRISTGASLEDVKNQMQGLASEISQQSKQMVTILTDLLIGRKSPK